MVNIPTDRLLGDATTNVGGIGEFGIGAPGGGMPQPTAPQGGGNAWDRIRQASPNGNRGRDMILALLAGVGNAFNPRPDPQMGAKIRGRLMGARQQNRSMQLLQQLSPRWAAYAQATGDYKGALRQAMSSSAPQRMMTVGEGQRVFDPNTGQFINPPGAGGAGPETATNKQSTQYNALVRRYDSTLPVKQYQITRQAYENMHSAYQASMQAPNAEAEAASQLIFVIALMKTLDPTSMVTGKEIATVQNAGGIEPRMRNLYNSLVKGRKLRPDQMKALMKQGEERYTNAADRLADTNARHAMDAKYMGLPEHFLITTPELRPLLPHIKPGSAPAGMVEVAPGIYRKP